MYLILLKKLTLCCLIVNIFYSWGQISSFCPAGLFSGWAKLPLADSFFSLYTQFLFQTWGCIVGSLCPCFARKLIIGTPITLSWTGSPTLSPAEVASEVNDSEVPAELKPLWLCKSLPSFLGCEPQKGLFSASSYSPTIPRILHRDKVIPVAKQKWEWLYSSGPQDGRIINTS